ncbi:hypothetical protein GCM10027610_091950 [Dactylosporangium cerinum]
MPAAAADNQPDNESTQVAEAETEAPPLNPLEAIRRAQANRSLPRACSSTAAARIRRQGRQGEVAPHVQPAQVAVPAAAWRPR